MRTPVEICLDAAERFSWALKEARREERTEVACDLTTQISTCRMLAEAIVAEQSLPPRCGGCGLDIPDQATIDQCRLEDCPQIIKGPRAFINEAAREPLGKSPGTALTGGYEQKDSRGSPVRDVPAASSPSTPRTDDLMMETNSGEPSHYYKALDLARKLERELAQCDAAWREERQKNRELRSLQYVEGVKCPKCDHPRQDLLLAACAQEGCPSVFNTTETAQALQNEMDATRYRFLRACGRGNRPEDFWVARGVLGVGVALWNGEHLDRAIDDALGISRPAGTPGDSSSAGDAD